MELVNKKTNELTREEIREYCSCFSKVMHRERDAAVFNTIFSNTCLGYSFHSLLKAEDGTVMGGYTSIPMLYEVDGKEMLFAFGVDLMVDESLRDDVSNLLTIIKGNDKVLKENGIKCFYGFPNDNSYIVNLAFIRMKDIASLETYILPWKVGAVKPSMKFLNPLSSLFTKILVASSRLCKNKSVTDYSIHKKRPEFDESRYNWFDKTEYRHYQDDEMTCHWKVSSFEGIDAAFLMDVYPMSNYNFDKAVRIAYKDCADKVGLLLYVGYLPFSPCSMIKVPKKFAPKNFHFVAKILDKQLLQKDMVYHVSNWDVNLASYDLL